jgi:hypothetical protein
MRAASGCICGALAVLAAVASPTGAVASAGLEPGVQIDPGSPAAKQYVLQLNQARQTGEQGSHSGSSTGLFGAGITPPGGGSAAGGGARTSTGQRATGRDVVRIHHASGSTSASKPAAPVALPPAVLRAARTQGSSAGSGSWLALIGGGVAVLLLGGFGGTVLRHSRRPTPSS